MRIGLLWPKSLTGYLSGVNLISQGRYWIDKLSGSDALRKMIEAGKSEDEIKATWQDDIDDFIIKRALYLIYE